MTIPDSVTTIQWAAFYEINYNRQIDVYYSSSESQWKKISIMDLNKYDTSISEGPFYWDCSYTVRGYNGDYLTNHAGVILGDFSQDGNPYLCVISSITKGCGFDVYYGTNGIVCKDLTRHIEEGAVP